MYKRQPLEAASAPSAAPAPASQAPVAGGSPLVTEAQLMTWVSGIVPQILAARDVPTILMAILTSLIALIVPSSTHG